MLLVAGLQNLL